MSERGNFRGRGNRGGRGGESRGGRGGGGRGGGAAGSDPKDKPKKENIIDLNRFLDKQLKVKFNGGREGMLRLDIPSSWEHAMLTWNSHSGWHVERLRSTHEFGSRRCARSHARYVCSFSIKIATYTNFP